MKLSTKFTLVAAMIATFASSAAYAGGSSDVDRRNQLDRERMQRDSQTRTIAVYSHRGVGQRAMNIKSTEPQSAWQFYGAGKHFGL